MELKKLLGFIEDRETLRRICEAMDSEVWRLKFDLDIAESEIKKLKKQNEELQESAEKSDDKLREEHSIESITILTGGR